MTTVDLLTAAKELARLATNPSGKVGDKSMRNGARSVLAAVAGAKPASVRGAVKALAAAAAKAEGPYADVLHLTLGALVEEAGAPADVAWPVLADALPDALAAATRFGVALVRAAKTQVVADALAAKGPEVAAAHPEEARAWQELPARCLAAAACLSRSRDLRDEARASGLRKQADALSLGVPEVAQIAQLLDAYEDEPLVVLHPLSRRGWEMRAREITMLAELLVMVADALCGDPKKGKLPGARPTPGAVKALRNDDPKTRGKPVRVPATFELLPPDAVDASGRLDVRAHAHDHGLDPSASPSTLARVFGKAVLLLRDPDHMHQMELEPPPGALSPRVEVVRELDASAVETWLTRLAGGARPKKAATKKAATKKAVTKKAATKKAVTKKAAKTDSKRRAGTARGR